MQARYKALGVYLLSLRLVAWETPARFPPVSADRVGPIGT